MAINIIDILNSISAESIIEDCTPFYIPEQKDAMDYYDFTMATKYPFEDTTDAEDNEEHSIYFEDWYAPLSYSNVNSKTRHRNHRRNMVKEKQKLHHRKEVYGTYRNLNFHSDGWMADYAKAQYAMGNKRVRNTFDIPSGKSGYKKLNGKGIW